MIDVITGFSPAGYEQYGKRMIETFGKYWCEQTFNLIPFVEESIKHKNEILVNSLDALDEFFRRHKDNPAVHGRKPMQCWKMRDIDTGYSYKTDAYKFCRIPFYIQAALRASSSKYLIWLDGDTYTFNPVNKLTITKLLPEGKAVAYLGRGSKHTECGFLLFNTELASSIINEWAEWYESDAFMGLSEWHNSYIFDVVIEEHKGIAHDMTPGGRSHVWFQSELGNFMDHLKGDKRKQLGHSSERDGLRI